MPRQSKVHTCPEAQAMAKTGNWTVIRGCHCKLMVEYVQADAMVKLGEAKWVAINQEFGTQEIACPFCKGDEKFAKTCPQCKGSGKGSRKVEWNKYNFDIVSTIHFAKNHSTPKVPTIEEAHIILAYVEEKEHAATRIEEYGALLNQLVLAERGARVRVQLSVDLEKKSGEIQPTGFDKDREGAVIHRGKLEPKDNAAKGEGRKYDWGRAI